VAVNGKVFTSFGSFPGFFGGGVGVLTEFCVGLNGHGVGNFCPIMCSFVDLLTPSRVSAMRMRNHVAASSRLGMGRLDVHGFAERRLHAGGRQCNGKKKKKMLLLKLGD
jgi:hypothetical protein